MVRELDGDGRRRLVLEEQVAPLPVDSLAGLGLSRRETEVLRWVAEGKSNEAIASILGLSVRTVHKRLRQARGREPGTAAAARAYEAAGLPRAR